MATTPPPARRLARAAGALRAVAVDTSPLKESRDFRLLWSGQVVSVIGRQMTVVAVPYQVYVLTRSTLALGLVGLVQVVPAIVVGLGGTAIVDAVDRRKMLLVTQTLLLACSGGLALGAIGLRAPLWMVYALTAAMAGVSAIDAPTRSAMIPRLVGVAKLPAALSLQQVVYQVGAVAGFSLGGLVIARVGLPGAYAIDAVTYVVALGAVAALSPHPPAEGAGRAGWSALTG